jgi:hypothetical protein
VAEALLVLLLLPALLVQLLLQLPAAHLQVVVTCSQASHLLQAQSHPHRLLLLLQALPSPAQPLLHWRLQALLCLAATALLGRPSPA